MHGVLLVNSFGLLGLQYVVISCPAGTPCHPARTSVASSHVSQGSTQRSAQTGHLQIESILDPEGVGCAFTVLYSNPLLMCIPIDKVDIYSL